MKLLHCALLSSSFVILHSSFLHAATFVHETAYEFSSTGDFNGDTFTDLLVIDKVTGLYRIGYGTGTGTITFAESRPTGVTGITGVTVGRWNSASHDSFAVTSPDENRAQILSPVTTGYTEPQSLLLAGLGPQLLVALDLPAGPGPTADDDLAVLATRDLTDTVHIRQLRQSAGIWSALRSDNAPDALCLRGNPVIPVMGAPQLFAFMRDDGFNDSFHAWHLTGVAATQVLNSANAQDDARFISGFFDGTNADLMFWRPGSNFVQVRRMGVSGPGWDFTSNDSFFMPPGVEQLCPVQTPGGMKVLIRNHMGIRIRGYTQASGFGAAEDIIPIGVSGFPTGVIPLPGNGFQALFGENGTTSSSAIAFTHNGTAWIQGATTTFTPLRPNRSFTNLLLLDSPPFRADNPILLHSYQVPDWTTGVLLGSPIQANAAPFTSSTTGLGAASTQAVGTSPAAPGGTLVNQLHAQFSISSFTTRLGPAIDAVRISPDPGAYDSAQQISFSDLDAGTSVYLRTTAAGAFQPWNPTSAPWLTRDTTVQYYSLPPGGAGAVQSAAYTFSRPPALQDADGDGVPDFVEISYGMDPEGGSDTDGDGYSDREEIAAGTNPNDAGDHPTSHASTLDAMLVEVRAQLKDSTGGTTAVAADGTQITVSDPFGNELGDRSIGVGTAAPTFCRVRTRAVDPAMGFLIVRTEKHFSTNPAGTNDPRGRELIGLIPALEPEVWSFATTDGAMGTPTAWSWGGTNWQAGSSNWTNGTTDTQGFDAGWSTSQLDPLWDSSPSGTYSAADWISAFQAAANRGARPYAEITLSPATSLGAVLVGKIIGDYIIEHDDRSTIDGTQLLFDGLNADTFKTLRRPTGSAILASKVRIIAVLRHVDDQLGGSDLGAQALRKLARDVYALHNALATDALDALSMPLDALASFVKTGALPADYLAVTTLTPAERSAASSKLTAIIASVPERSTTTQTMYVRGEAPTPGLSLVNDTVATPHLLLDERIRALSLPSPDEAPEGTPLQITAFNDLPQIAGYAGLEVTSLTLTSLPLVVDEDSDGDLLADSWELRHFGTLDYDTLMNRDGSLYSLAQEYLDGTDPRSASSSPVLAPVLLALRNFRLTSLGGGSFAIRAEWPPAYANAIEAMIQSSPDLVEWFLPNPAPYIGGGEFREIFSNSDPRFFYRAFPALRR
jgi:hypothetical protein